MANTDNSEIGIAQLAASLMRGSVIAAAGCGKTEQIARATKIAQGRRLILTHTHAGVDVLRARLKSHEISSDRYHVDTIASWCLRYVASFPKQSQYVCDKANPDTEWDAIYEATAKLIQSGAVNGILKASYSGVFVDEYQDCTSLQHNVIKGIAIHIPVCVFGDPLQAIFDFKNQNPVSWDTEVFPVFSKVGELTVPWRWKKVGNDALANWLTLIRQTLDCQGTLNLTSRPSCVRWERLPNEPEFRQRKIIGTCQSVLGASNNETIVVIGDSANINARAALAKGLASIGFSNIEPLSCKPLFEYAQRLESSTGYARFEYVLDFIGACMTGTEKSEYIKAIKSHLSGGKAGTAKFGSLIGKGIAIVNGGADEALIELMAAFQARSNTHLFRREMFFAMQSALRIKTTTPHNSLQDAVAEVQHRIRHTGRRIGKRSIGSTLLVKGLEFEHVVIIHSNNMSIKDWYVALTRATQSITILSPSESFTFS